MKIVYQFIVLLLSFVLAGCYASSHNVDAQLQTPQEFTIQSDLLFEFDKSCLSEDGKSIVSYLAQKIKSAQRQQITILGYTDRLGSAEYNLKLSQQRADTVKTYLEKLGVEGNITATGLGATAQIVACEDVPSAQLKACLEPNRRVHLKAQ